MAGSRPPAADALAWRRALVLGGIRSGKSEYAEALARESPQSVREQDAGEQCAGEQVVYVATARRLPGDSAWNARIDAHRARRPPWWRTAEIGASPLDLPDLLNAADPGDTVLLDDLGTWLASVMEVTPHGHADGLNNAITSLAESVGACSARLVMVSPEVGLSVIAENAAARDFADALGTTNRMVASACDRVVLVIAGNAVPVKGGL